MDTPTPNKSSQDSAQTTRRAGRFPCLGPKWIPMLKRHGVYLFFVDGNGRRFADLFARTWKQLPLSCRRKLLKLWRRTRPTTGADIPWPSIELVAGKSDYSRGNSDDAIAQYKSYFYSFSFHSWYMDRLSDASVQAVIAHELAHAILIIKDGQSHLDDTEYDELGFSMGEYLADEQADMWGFDMQRRDEELVKLYSLRCQ